MELKSYIIGISGASGSGKSTFAENLAQKFPKGTVLIIAQDAYYKELTDMSLEEKSNQNFDHPDSLDFKLLKEHLNDLKKGTKIHQPIYDFNTHSRTQNTTPINAHKIIIVEGTLLLSQKLIYKDFDCKIFVKLEEQNCLERRINRDISERGRSKEDILKQYNATVKPMYDKFIAPSESNADLVVPGLNNELQIEYMHNVILKKLNH